MKIFKVLLLILGISFFTVACGSSGGGSSGEGSTTTTSDIKSWGTAELIETENAGHTYLPKVAVDASGNTFAVWYQSDGTRTNVWANRYVAGTGWGTAELIETDNAGDANFPKVAVNSSGNAFAVWRQSDGTQFNFWANRYVAGTGWGTAQLIENNSWGNIGDVNWRSSIAVDTSGNAIAVWSQSDGTRFNIYENRYEVGIGWGVDEPIELDNDGDATNPIIAVDTGGNAIAVWSQSDGTRTNVWAARWTPTTVWVLPELIETDNAGDASRPEIAFDSSGNAIAVWFQNDGTRDNIWANRYVVGTGWGTAELIETDNTGDAWFPKVAVDTSGNAIAVWTQSDGTRTNVWVNRYVAGTGWGTAELIETDNAGDAFGSKVAFDTSGNSIAVWHQNDGTRPNIWANRYVAGTGWGTAELIETDNAGPALDAVIAFDTNGNAIAVWNQSDGTRTNIWSNRFD